MTPTETLALPTLAAFEHRRGKVRTLRSPYDCAELATIPVCDDRDVDRAVRVAVAAMAAPLPTWERAEILDKVATALHAERERFARIVAAEAAKPLRTARIEVDRAAATFKFAAAASRTFAGEVVPVDASSAGAGKVAFTLRVPVGVIGAITPFNFPLNLVAHKVAPAIAAGCAVVVKPADQTPLSSIALMRLMTETCGLPPGWVTVITGRGSVVGRALVDHRDVAMITFTGSPDVGWGIRSRAPRKRVALELGNNAPVIIEPDGDWQRADSSAPDERDRVTTWIDEACAAGATIAAGGTIEGSLLQPTVLTDVDADMKVSKHEVFGPVVGIQSYQDYDDALARANDSTFGLQAGVFTPDISKALQAARTLDFGGVVINDVPTWRADNQPYGGVRDSGNTREGPAYSIREMTEARLVVFDSGESSA